MKLSVSAFFIVLIFLSASFASKTYAAVVINEVYGAGGNSGATYNQDFVELYNNGTVSVDITGFSLQYASATGSFGTIGCNITAPDTIIEAGTYFLIATGSASMTNGIALPTPNATCSGISMAATAGKVALVNNTTLLTGTCPTGASIVDFVGYGTTANCSEGGAPADAPSTTTSTQRIPAGTDTNNNAADFQAAAPTPQAAAGPTAAPASISGQVTMTSGRGISKVRIMLSGGDLEYPIFARTNSFGYYKFENLPAGETYILEVTSRRYTFANPTLVVNLQDNLSETNFFGELIQDGAK